MMLLVYICVFCILNPALINPMEIAVLKVHFRIECYLPDRAAVLASKECTETNDLIVV